MSERYYKVLDLDGSSCHGGTGKWHLPRYSRGKWIPGEWMPKIEDIVPCESGYHLCRRQDLVHWLGPTIYVAEARGAIVENDNKVVTQESRLLERLPWDECAARLYAVECAYEVLPIFERECPNDDRPAQALEVAFLYALGEASDADLAAAWDAARAAVRDAAWNAAGAAAGAAARAAAWDAAWTAAWDAAEDAARAGAWAAQTDRLMSWLGEEQADA